MIPSKNELLKILHLHFGDVIEPETTMDELVLLGEGFSQCVYAINEQFVLRIPKSDEAIINLRNGLLIEQWLSDQNLVFPFPRPRMIQAIDEPYPMILMERLPGKTPSNVHDQVRAETAVQLAFLLKMLHGCEPNGLRDLGIDQPRYRRMEREILQKDILLRLMDAQEKNWLTREEMERIRYWMGIFESFPNLDARKVGVHGDFHPLNFLVNSNGRITAVIDWDDAHLSHPAIDLSIVYTWLPLEARNAFWKEYGDQDETTQIWARITGIYIAIHVLWASIMMRDHEREAFARQMLQDGVSS